MQYGWKIRAIPAPCFALRAAGAQVVPSRWIEDGLIVAEGRKRTATRENGLRHAVESISARRGHVAASPARTADWAAQENAWIVEDEYDAEYRYFGRPVPSLHSMDRSGCVIYVGTFTKMLFNSLRLGLSGCSGAYCRCVCRRPHLLDRHPPTLEQAILTDFILDGHFGHHVRRMRQMYARRMAVLCDASRESLAGGLDVVEADSGMRTLGWIRTGERDADVANRARASGLEVAALSDFSRSHSHPDALILGFAGCPAAELKRGVGVLARALDTDHANSRPDQSTNPAP